jgi:hypothetical protein
MARPPARDGPAPERTMTAERQFLLGLLALQNGMVDQAQLVATFQAWILDKARSLADHLVALGFLSAAQRAAIEAIASLHVEAHGGDVEKSIAAVPAAPEARAGLARLGAPEIEATLARVS